MLGERALVFGLERERLLHQAGDPPTGWQGGARVLLSLWSVEESPSDAQGEEGGDGRSGCWQARPGVGAPLLQQSCVWTQTGCWLPVPNPAGLVATRRESTQRLA